MQIDGFWDDMTRAQKLSMEKKSLENTIGEYEDCVSELEDLKAEDFFRIHRSVLVNLRRIVKITRTDVTLDSGDVLPVARGKYDAVNRAFIERVT